MGILPVRLGKMLIPQKLQLQRFALRSNQSFWALRNFVWAHCVRPHKIKGFRHRYEGFSHQVVESQFLLRAALRAALNKNFVPHALAKRCI
jgi:hypothetical protein